MGHALFHKRVKMEIIRVGRDMGGSLKIFSYRDWRKLKAD